MNPAVIDWRATRKAVREGGAAFAALEDLLHPLAARQRAALLLWPDTVLREIILLARDMGSMHRGVVPKAKRERLIAFTRALYDASSPEQQARYFWSLDTEDEAKPMTWALCATRYASCPELVALLLEHCGCRFNTEIDGKTEPFLIHRLALNGRSEELRVIAKYVRGVFAHPNEPWGHRGSALFCAAQGGYPESASVLLSHYYGSTLPGDLSRVIVWLNEERATGFFHETTDALLKLLEQRLVHARVAAERSGFSTRNFFNRDF